MKINQETLFEFVKNLNIIKSEELEKIYKISKEKNLPLEKILIEKDLIKEKDLGQIIADIIKIPFIDLSNTQIDKKILTTIPEIFARKQKVIAFKKDEKGVHLALNDPHNIEIIEFIEKKTGIPVVPYYAVESDIENALGLYQEDLAETFEEIINKNSKKAENLSENDEIPIINIVNSIIIHAYKNKASDIHIEPTKDKEIIRFRIDGILHDIASLPLTIHNLIVTRIKIMAKLRTDEHQAPQDGKIQFFLSEKNNSDYIDIRVSIVPIITGEKIVMRLLSSKTRQFSLLNLGLNDQDLEKLKKAIKKPYGMILSTGPTGSGKTTTMYAIIKILNEREKNIMTIEDPVEYDIEGINQIQVNPKTNLTFASGLRSILRQDPNVILVGEIRDEETAQIAINAALTGHLVLSTLHTNNASTTIPRLIDMKIEPYLIASTLNIVIGQRLVRKICLKCRTSKEITLEELEKNILEKSLLEKIKKIFFKENKKIRVYYGKGCPICHNTGYEGRIGIFEVMEITEDIKKAIMEKKNASEIEKIAIKEKMTTMIDDGFEKVTQGITTIEEVIRAVKY